MNQRIWITGASSGIGQALALACAKAGMQVVISGRNTQQLQALQAQHNNMVLALPFDVSHKQAHFVAAETIKATLGGLDIAVFNAGFSEHMEVANFNSELCEKLMSVNYFSICYGIEATLPLLRQSKTPHLVGMSSIAAYGGLPQGAAYCASKAAVKALLEGLRVELMDENIPVSIICPGFVKTPLTAKHKFKLPAAISADKAANIILRGIAKQQHEIHFPKRISVLQKLITSLPSPLYTRIMRLALKRIKRQERQLASGLD
jgi:short-subunit dehydrogenase